MAAYPFSQARLTAPQMNLSNKQPRQTKQAGMQNAAARRLQGSKKPTKPNAGNRP